MDYIKLGHTLLQTRTNIPHKMHKSVVYKVNDTNYLYLIKKLHNFNAVKEELVKIIAWAEAVQGDNNSQ
ncbi:hypothetical protein N476_21595 [Pseudoalteromonas luteoviolacea H33]|uniref:Uncharacterized protein n=1 Tax=Pseudoalteromonas luteoviolacea H33 TaxID=1365251 RepID=A0A161XYP9_9GAMM|nr:hypothetical protein N476_21595 [Pseudoalteromonas luteoviolacea H33]KZN73330.1 hypothetical protein N477_23695 [Pseudoalteromonas luteoviolacea H33-S]